MTTEFITVEAERTTLDLLLWRRFKREVTGLVEATFDLNPGLAGHGLFLPVGLKVKVTPPPPQPRGRVAVRVVSLYE